MRSGVINLHPGKSQLKFGSFQQLLRDYNLDSFSRDFTLRMPYQELQFGDAKLNVGLKSPSSGWSFDFTQLSFMGKLIVDKPFTALLEAAFP